MTKNDDYVLQLLQELGYLTSEQVKAAAVTAEAGVETVLDVLVKDRVISKQTVIRAIAEHFRGNEEGVFELFGVKNERGKGMSENGKEVDVGGLCKEVGRLSALVDALAKRVARAEKRFDTLMFVLLGTSVAELRKEHVEE